MSKQKNGERDIVKGLVAGLIAGAFASWTMNLYQAAFQKVAKTWRENDPRKSNSQQEQQSSEEQSEDEDATMKMAGLLGEKVLHRQLSKEEKKKASPFVHYGYGTLAGGLYGAAAELVPAIKKGSGTLYATALFIGGDEIAVPALNLSGSPKEFPLSVHANALASHLVYGVSAEVARRLARWAM